MKTRSLLLLSAVLIQAVSSLGCIVTSGGEAARAPSVTVIAVGMPGAPACAGNWNPQCALVKRGGADPVFESPVAAPSSCAEVKAASPGAGDGEYMLGVSGRQVSIYCKGMAGTPAEYLTLRQTGGGANTSRYGQGQNTGPDGLTTAYTRVRFHPDTLRVEWNDATFASSAGWNQFGKNRNATWGWGSAGDCVGDRSATGVASIDLRGTLFAVAPDQFVTAGFHPEGTMHYSARRQIVTLTGGGYCGQTAPTTPNLQLTWLDA